MLYMSYNIHSMYVIYYHILLTSTCIYHSTCVHCDMLYYIIFYILFALYIYHCYTYISVYMCIYVGCECSMRLHGPGLPSPDDRTTINSQVYMRIYMYIYMYTVIHITVLEYVIIYYTLMPFVTCVYSSIVMHIYLYLCIYRVKDGGGMDNPCPIS